MHVIVHGGAGTAPAEPTERQAVLDEAATAGSAEATPLDAVESAVRVLERDERFNAGYGSAVQADGVVRVDAGVMTSEREIGAVAALTGVEHAVSAARAVCAETPHVMLAGGPAEAFTEELGIPTHVDLTTPATRERFADADAPTEADAQLAWVRDHFGDDAGGADPTLRDHDTVGAVAGDGERFAAATSTGGRWFALAGRVGDVPQAGSGFCCSPAGGASATGAGEDITRSTLTRRAVDRLEAGDDAQTAADAALERFTNETESTAGLIVLSDTGVGSAYNSEAMQTSVSQR